MNSKLENVLYKKGVDFHPVVDFHPETDRLFHLDFSAGNHVLGSIDITDTAKLSAYVNSQIQAAGCKYGIGGYNENRILYKRSKLFEAEADRSIHLGIDIWGPAGTKVYAPVGGVVHSFGYNDHFGDYGATVILQHQLDTIVFHTLYGHLGLKDIAPLQQGKYMNRGEVVGHFGEPHENGNWPPHLHFQVIEDMRLYEGDYPGVCCPAESEAFLRNCPNPDLILNMMRY
jgi:peptidoglycan LD-endopeptidase LytH